MSESDEKTDQKTLTELIEDSQIAMFTTIAADGTPRSFPMARQEVTDDTNLWFITARNTQHVDAIVANPRVALTFSNRDSWVAVTGTADVVDDLPKLKELWSPFAEAWLPGGPEDPNAVLVHVDVDGGEYWDTPGGTVATLISFVKTKVTGEPYEGNHGEI